MRHHQRTESQGGQAVSDTPRTLQEECYGTCWAACERIEELEAQVKAYANRIKRLEEAGDAMHWAFSHHDTGNESVADAWRKAKEDKL
jgi:hypothetical protein